VNVTTTSTTTTSRPTSRLLSLFGTFSALQKCLWAKSELLPGKALREPAPLFEKLDENVIEEEYARLEG
jgi:hypothetical protein